MTDLPLTEGFISLGNFARAWARGDECVLDGLGNWSCQRQCQCQWEGWRWGGKKGTQRKRARPCALKYGRSMAKRHQRSNPTTRHSTPLEMTVMLMYMQFRGCHCFNRFLASTSQARRTARCDGSRFAVLVGHVLMVQECFHPF